MCPPRCECRPTPWEGSSDARCCHWRRANPAMELHPVAALCVGDGGTGVDRAVPESDFWICAPGRIVLEPRRHVGAAAVARSGLHRRDLGHHGIALHDPLPSGTLGDAPAVGRVVVVGRAPDGVVLLGRPREVSHRAGRLGVGSAQAERAAHYRDPEKRDHLATRDARRHVAPPRRAVARVLHAGVLVDDRGHNFHLYAEAYGERVARRAHRL